MHGLPPAASWCHELSRPTRACLTCTAAAVLGVGLCARCTLRGALVGTLQALRETGVLVTGVYVLSPLLQSLTSTVSSDSVTALVVACLLVHLLLHDYTFSPAADVAATLSGSLSLGAAICASVLLASRLDDTLQVFGLVCCGLQAFVAWPFLRRDIRAAWPTCHVVMTCALHAATCAALARVSAVLAAVHVAAVLFITFACPWWLVQCHDIKQRINGCAHCSLSCVPSTESSVGSARSLLFVSHFAQALGRSPHRHQPNHVNECMICTLTRLSAGPTKMMMTLRSPSSFPFRRMAEVLVRVRPLTAREASGGGRCVAVSGGKVQVTPACGQPALAFEFDACWDSDASQADVAKRVSHHVDRVLGGYNGARLCGVSNCNSVAPAHTVTHSCRAHVWPIWHRQDIHYGHQPPGGAPGGAAGCGRRPCAAPGFKAVRCSGHRRVARRRQQPRDAHLR